MKLVKLFYKQAIIERKCEKYEHIGSFLYLHCKHEIEVFHLTPDIAFFTIADTEPTVEFDIQEDKP